MLLLLLLAMLGRSSVDRLLRSVGGTWEAHCRYSRALQAEPARLEKDFGNSLAILYVSQRVLRSKCT